MRKCLNGKPEKKFKAALAALCAFLVMQAFAAAPAWAGIGTGNGLCADYYAGENFDTFAFKETDPVVDFSWAPGVAPGTIGTGPFSVRWHGKIEAPATGIINFCTNCDDGSRLWVNGVQLVNDWTDHGAYDVCGTINMTDGQYYDIVFEYYENGYGPADAHLKWSYGAMTVTAAVPQTQLYCSCLTTEKSVNTSVAAIGDIVTYILTTNNCGVALNNASIWDTLASNLTMQSSNPAPSYNNGRYHRWDLGTMAGGSVYSVTITASVDSGVNGQVVHNVASNIATGMPIFSSNDAFFTIFTPGTELQKSANPSTRYPGETTTYTITWFNPRPTPNPTKMNLRVKSSQYDGSSISYAFQITNLSGAGVDISHLSIGWWMSDSIAPASISHANDYGGGTTPFAGWNGPPIDASFIALNPPILTPADRQAAMKVVYSTASTNILPNNTVWDGIQQRLQVSWPVQFLNRTNYYSKDPGAAYVDDPHFVLYYDGVPISEWLDAATPDPNTGCEPGYVEISDIIPDDINYAGSSPAATLTGNTLSWDSSCVAGGSTVTIQWWGSVKAGTPGGTVIPNRATYDYYSAAGLLQGLSLFANVTVIGATPTFTRTSTRTNTPTFSCTQTPSYTATATPTFTATQTFTPTFTPTYTRTISPSSTNTGSPTFTRTMSPTATNTPSPTFTGTWTPTFTGTDTRTDTPTGTYTRTVTPTATCTDTPTPTYTRTNTLTFTPTFTATPTVTITSMDTPTVTRTITPTFTETPTYTATATFTATASFTPTRTNTDTNTPSPTDTATVTFTPTFTITATVTETSIYTATVTPTITDTSTETPTYTATNTFTPTRSFTPTFTVTDTVTETSVYTLTCTPTATDTRTPSPSATASPTWTFTRTWSQTFTMTETLTFTPTFTCTFTATDTRTETPTHTFTRTATQTFTPTITATISPTAPETPFMISVEVYNEAGEKVDFIGQASVGQNALDMDLLVNGSGAGIFDPDSGALVVSFPGIKAIGTAGGTLQFTWQGNCDNGQKAGDGVYYIKAMMTDDYGHVFTVVKNITLLRNEAYVRVSIYNAAGELVRRLVNKGSPAAPMDPDTEQVIYIGKDNAKIQLKYGPTGFFDWDGRSALGRVVSSGTYELRFESKTETGITNEILRTVTILTAEDKSVLGSVKIYPNPYVAGDALVQQVTIAWSKPAPGKVIVKIYNFAGELVRRIDADLAAGSVVWDLGTQSGAGAGSGVYAVFLDGISSDGNRETKTARMAVIKNVDYSGY